MKLSEFVNIFTMALYDYSEVNGIGYHPVSTILSTYGLIFKNTWYPVILQDPEFSSRIEYSATYGDFDDQVVMISARGIRWAEEEIGEGNAAEYLRRYSKSNSQSPIGEVQALSTQLAPAADRLVTLSHNQPERMEIISELKKVSSALKGSNTLAAEEKADVLANLSVAETLVETSDTWFAGAMKYLVFDRVQKAFEKLIEDAIRYVIIGSLVAIATIIMALI